MTELRKISTEELKETLENHVIWLEKKDREVTDPLRADLSLVDLKGIKLIGTNLCGAILSGADLSGADLFKANLSEANLNGADLSRANLSEANLSNAYLVETDLIRANLRGSNLIGTELGGADLSKANVSRVEYDIKGKYQGIYVKTCYGNLAFKRHAQGQEYLNKFKDNHPALYFIWNLIVDYRSSIGHSVLWTIAISALFALMYYLLGEGVFDL